MLSTASCVGKGNLCANLKSVIFLTNSVLAQTLPTQCTKAVMIASNHYLKGQSDAESFYIDCVNYFLEFLWHTNAKFGFGE